MIEFIYASSDKRIRQEFFKKAEACISDGRRSYLVVPEQLVLAYEDDAGRYLPPSAPLSFTVASFSLLSDIASRQFGALSYKTLTKPQKVLFMWKAIRDTLPFLQTYKNCSPESLCARMLECTDDLKSAGISPEMLADASVHLINTPLFSNKLSDIATVYSAYTALTKNKYSDMNDELSKLLAFLSEKDMFSGYDIYIDSFTDFTPLQLAVIRHMINRADNVYISFPSDPIDDSLIQFECIRSTFHDLLALCDMHDKEYCIRNLDEECKKNSALGHLAKNILAPSPKVFNGEFGDNEKIEVYSCRDIQEEICACINLIKKSLYEGYRQSDIAVISRSPEKYEKLLALSASDAGISMFTANKRKVSEGNFAVYILSLLRMISGSLQRNDVIAHLKSGLCDFSDDDINRFDIYTSRWGIDGFSPFLSKDFTAPFNKFKKDGGTDDSFTEASNRIKNGLFPKISALQKKLESSGTLKEMLTLLFEYLEDAKVSEKLSYTAKKFAESGDVQTAQQVSRTYNATIRIFDDIAYSLEDEPAISVKELCSMLDLVMSSTEIGSIPTRKDEVILGDASLYRSFGHKVVVILGAAEGVFPQSVKLSGLITEAEKAILKEEGMPMRLSAITAASKEYFFLWRAITTAKEKLYITYPQKDANDGECAPSTAVKNISFIFGNCHSHIFSQCMYELTYDPFSILSGLSSLESDSIFKEFAREYFKDIGSDAVRIGTKKASISSDHSLSESVANELLPFPVTISPTALENYNKCAFSYFCANFLNLDDGKKNEFSALISGSLVHSILEKYLESGKNYSPKETAELCKRIADEYYKRICPEHMSDNEKLKINFTRAAINASLLAQFVSRDIESSGFTPTDTEKKIKTILSEDNGDKIILSGKTDRVDKAELGDRTFTRVIDYKTGSKVFSLEETAEGLELQLPLYLSALMKEEASTLPGGFLYLSSAVSRHDVSSAKELYDEEKLDADIVSGITSSGVLNSLFTRSKNSKLVGLAEDELKAILKQAEDTAIATVKRMRSGNISALPGTNKACEYCPYISVCRSKKEK